MEEVAYDRDGDDLVSRELYLDTPPWKASVLGMTAKQIHRAA
jgi:hypothetical protein